MASDLSSEPLHLLVRRSSSAPRVLNLVRVTLLLGIGLAAAGPEPVPLRLSYEVLGGNAGEKIFLHIKIRKEACRRGTLEY